MNNSLDRQLPEQLLSRLGLQPHRENNALKDTRPFQERLAHNGKLQASLEDAIRAAGLKDGMTVSFHHHFRGGDYLVNLVADKLADMGYRDLKIAASSLTDVHAPLIKHIENGVVTRIETSGLRGKLADAVSHGLMREPVIFRSHGGRASAIAAGSLPIDVAFLGAASADALGNASGCYGDADGKSMCGSLGYAQVDACYARRVVAITDHLVPYPNTPFSIPATAVDYVVRVEAVGDAGKISSGATRFTTNPRDLLIAETAAKVIMASGYVRDGFSLQTGSGGAALAVTRFISEEMLARGVKAGFALGGVTGQMVKLHEAGLIEKLLDVQSFDLDAARSLRDNPGHTEVDACHYASPFNEGSAIHQLDVVILSALEVDIQFNVNVLTGSDGVIRGAVGGHPDTAAGAALTVLATPLIRGRIPCVVERVGCLVTEGKHCDVLVTDMGIAVNPRRPEVAERLRAAGIRLKSIQALKEEAEAIAGKPAPLPWGEKIVALVTHPDGTVLDAIREIRDGQ